MNAGIEILVAVGGAATDAVQLVLRQPGTRVFCCRDAEDAIETLSEILTVGDIVWVKGSRLMQLDRVVSELEARFGEQAAVA